MDMSAASVSSLICLNVSSCSSGGSHVGVGGAPPPREAPAAEATAERPVLPAEAPAAEEAREGAS